MSHFFNVLNVFIDVVVTVCTFFVAYDLINRCKGNYFFGNSAKHDVKDSLTGQEINVSAVFRHKKTSLFSRTER